MLRGAGGTGLIYGNKNPLMQLILRQGERCAVGQPFDTYIPGRNPLSPATGSMPGGPIDVHGLQFVKIIYKHC
jgi:hypothetical protein